MAKPDMPQQNEVPFFDQWQYIKAALNSEDPIKTLLEKTQPITEPIKRHLKPAQNNMLGPCVDERLLVTKVTRNNSGELVSTEISPSQELESVPLTPFPGGRVGIYGATALAMLLSEEKQSIIFNSTSDQGFLDHFLDLITQQAETIIKAQNVTSENLAIHIDAHHREDLYTADKIDPEKLKALVKKGTGCGFAGVFIQVIYHFLLLSEQEAVAKQFATAAKIKISESDPNLTEVSPEVKNKVAQTLISKAFAQGSPMTILLGEHNARSVNYTVSDLLGLDKNALITQEQEMAFEANLAWAKSENDGGTIAGNLVDQIFKTITPNMSNFKEKLAVGLNAITFKLLGQGGKPTYQA